MSQLGLVTQPTSMIDNRQLSTGIVCSMRRHDHVRGKAAYLCKEQRTQALNLT